MITLDLIEFIEKAQKKGTSKEIIVSKLLNAGWHQEDINEGFDKVTPLYPRTAPILNIEPKVEPKINIVPKTEPKIDITPKVEPVVITPSVVEIPKFVEPAASAAVPISVPVVEKKIEPEIKPDVVVEPKVAPKVIEPIVFKPVEKVEAPTQVKKEEIVKPDIVNIPRVDPYREPAHTPAPVKYQESSVYSLGVNTVLPKLWVPSNLPIKVEENTEMIPTLIPKKVDVFVEPKKVLPPKYSEERKIALSKVYAAPEKVATQVETQNEIKDILGEEPKVAPLAAIAVDAPKIEKVSEVVVPVLDIPKENASTQAIASEALPEEVKVEAKQSVDPYKEDLVSGQIPAVIQKPAEPSPVVVSASSVPVIEKPIIAQKLPPVTPVVKPLIVEVPKNPAYPSVSSAITSSYSKDMANNFVPTVKKPGIPRFLVWMFVFVVIICILGGVAFAYMNGLLNLPFLPKVNPTSVTAKYVKQLSVTNQDSNTPPVDINAVNNSSDQNPQVNTGNTGVLPGDNPALAPTSTPSDLKSSMTPVVLPPSLNELKGKDSMIGNYMKSLELQIYKKYAINKNSYGLKSNTKGDCVAPVKDSLFYTDPADTSDKTIAHFLNPLLELENNNGYCYSTSKDWAMSFPLATDPTTYMCIDSFGTSINTKNILKNTTCK